MTGFAQVKGQVGTSLAFSLSLKSVNHRFLDVHFRMPSGSDGLEMKLRRIFKERIARGHVELTLSLERADGNAQRLPEPGGVEGFDHDVGAEKLGAAGAEIDQPEQRLNPVRPGRRHVTPHFPPCGLLVERKPDSLRGLWCEPRTGSVKNFT